MVNIKPSHITIIIFLFFFGSCKHEPFSPDVKKNYRTVIVYMEANNDLRYDALNCINGMEKGALNIDGVMLVYIKTENKKSYLLKIKYDGDSNKIVSDTVKTFINENPSDPKFMKQVIQYSQDQYPSSSYGLVLWSHASSWAPPTKQKPKTESFGLDRGYEMDIIEMRDALPNNFDFIIFDACNMAGLEVLFEFKDKTKYIIASPTETIAESYPYQLITPDLFKGLDQLKNVSEGYFNYFNAYKDNRRSATVSLFKTDELPQLAKQMKALMQKNKKIGDVFFSFGVQRMDFSSNFPVPAYDFAGFLQANFQSDDFKTVLEQLNQTILYKANTPSFLGTPINTYSGVTCYIPAKDDINLAYYKRLQWYRDSGFYTLFEQ